MIITRTPLRMSFVGGGSDLPAFYKRSRGAVLSTAINRYVYISIHPYFHSNRYLLKYSKTENIDKIRDIKHPIIREAIELTGSSSGLEISSSADVPSGTGLGSSSSFTVGLLHCLQSYLGQSVDSRHLAESACKIEINRLNEPIGKQDQYAAAYGGLNVIEFDSDGSVKVEPISIDSRTKMELESNLLVFYIGGSRSASKILENQKVSLSEDRTFDIQSQMVDLVYELKESLLSPDLERFGRILNKNWQLKKQLAHGISNRDIDGTYKIGLRNGALGGKLLGAGGTGFMLFYCERQNQEKLVTALKKYQCFKFRFDEIGSTLIHSDSQSIIE